MHCDSTPRPTFVQPDRLCSIKSAQTDIRLTIMDVFGKERFIYAQTGDDGKVRVLTLPCEKLEVSPDALDELAKLVRSIQVTVKETP